MIEFAKQIADKWNISPALSEMICDAFQKGDTPYYVAEYLPEAAVEVSVAFLWEMYDFLSAMEELGSKKKRVLNALKKAEKLTPAIERRVNFTASSFELDDMLLPLRPNPRSRGQLAIKKGIEPLADLIAAQTEQKKSIEELADEYVGKDPSLSSSAEVIAGVKDVLAERFAYDDTVRAMVREFAYDDGYFEVTPKNKQDPRFTKYAGKQPQIADLTKEEMLTLLTAEEEKSVRVKLGVQLFRVTELLRHHFIVDPDFSGFDLLCEIIDDAWARLLQPIIERDVKIRLREEAEEAVAQRMAPELEKKYAEDQRRGTLLVVDAANPKFMFFIVVNGHGVLVGATTEKRAHDGKIVSYDRLRQFYLRHRPTDIIICENDQAPAANETIAKMVENDEQPPQIAMYRAEADAQNPADAEWVKKKYETMLEPDARKLYGTALLYLKPVEMIQHLGVHYYSVHPLQQAMGRERFLKIVNRIVTDAELHKGILIKDIVESPFAKIGLTTPELLQAVRSTDAQEPFASKNSILSVPGMTEVIFRNIAGFLLVQSSEDFRDRSLVHPDHFGVLDEASEQLNVSLDTIAADPEILRSFAVEDFIKKIYIEKKLIGQVRATVRALASSALKAKRKLKLTELKEGAIVSGRVTNITPFGVFVNINAVCDGLIHISQLADEYVETPEQVVAVHDRVDVRILKVDAKKRRISLSMKNLGVKGPRVKPSAGQLSTLAEHFKNR
jgi:protein Tex